MTARRTFVLALTLAGVVALPGCGKGARFDRELLAALHRTERLSRRFTYLDDAGKQRYTVQGLVEDDFRYKAQVTVNGRPGVEQVASDDAFALRFLEPTLIGRFLSQDALAAAQTTRVTLPNAAPAPKGALSAPATVGPSLLQVLATRRWVVDGAAAPSLDVTDKDFARVGQNPVFDSLTVLPYIEQAVDAAQLVVKFNAESLEYRPHEDPFKDFKPAKGIVRYDLIGPRLPRAGDQAAGNAANEAVPGIEHFRKMAVYVKDGVVVEVRETIDVERRLRDLERIYSYKFPKNKSPRELAIAALDVINGLRASQGLEPIPLRSMHLRIFEPGRPQLVTMPSDGIPAELAALAGRPVSTPRPGAPRPGAPSQPSDASTTTTTTGG